MKIIQIATLAVIMLLAMLPAALSANLTTTQPDEAANSIIPVFIETNIDRLTPSYSENVKVTGKLNEKAAVTAYVNGKAQKTVVADENGIFGIPIKLSKTAKSAISGTAKSVSVDTGEGWDNKIYLEAVDIAGHTTKTPETRITLASCGSGNWFNVQIDQPTPASLTPRLLLQNIQQIGMPVNITYAGNYEAVVRPGQVRIVSPILSGEFSDKYDNGWAEPNLLLSPTGKGSFQGYAQILLNHVPDPGSETRRANEINISENREGSCLVPGFGCTKLFLQLEIPFQEKIPSNFAPGTQTTQQEQFTLQNHVQKTCLNVEVLIDKPVPDNVLPKGALNRTVTMLTSIIDSIDVVLKPLTTIYTYTFYACAVATLWYYVFGALKEEFSCNFTSTAGIVGGGAFSTDVAQAGLCDQVYSDSQDAASKQNCNTCQSAVKNRMEFLNKYYKPLCDRIGCPSAPTAQTYVKAAQNDFNAIPQTKGKTVDFTVGETKAFTKGSTYYSGNDCAAWAEQHKTGTRLDTSYANIKDLYAEYQKMSADDKKKCSEPHPVNAACCAVSYMNDWGSACGVPVGGLDTFDELKESTCLAAEKVGRNSIETETGEVGCNKIWNSIAGFCEPGSGTPTSQPVYVGALRNENEFPAYKNGLYVFVIPRTAASAFTLVKTAQPYEIILGYAQDQLKFDQAEANSGVLGKKSTDKYRLSTGLYAVPIDLRGDQATFDNAFSETAVKDYTQNKKLPSGFAGVLNKYSTISTGNADKIYAEVVSIIGESDQEFIVKPESSFFRSIQCGCLPAAVSYLQLWRNIFGVVRNCFQSVMVTGDGSAGVCQETLSTQICDLMYEGIQCFSQKFNVGGAGGRVAGEGIGNVFRAFTNAGYKVSQTISGRYGDSGMYKALFADRKLAHAVCAFAFTGTWNLDATALLQQSISETPVASTGLVYPCERRYVAYNPLTSPAGLTTWNYHVGVGLAAGADLTYKLELKCSQGFGCEPKDGFVNGECDCNKKQEQAFRVTQLAGNSLKKNDLIGDGVDVIMQAGDPNSNVRYDKAVLSWEWNDGKQMQTGNTECKINQVGAEPPAFCAFDTFSLSYRCKFGDELTGIKFNDLTAGYQYQTANRAPTFALNHPLVFNINVRQTMPTTEKDKPGAEKQLTYIVKNQYGMTVASQTYQELMERPATSDTILAVDGDYTRTITIPSQFSESSFSPTTGESQYAVDVWKENDITPGATRLLYENSLNAAIDQPATQTQYYVVEVAQDTASKQNLVKAYMSSAAGASGTQFVKKEQLESKDGYALDLCENSDCVFTFTPSPTANVAQGTTTLSVRFTRPVDISQGKMQFRISYPRTTTSKIINPCATDKGKPAIWTMQVAAYTVDKSGTITNQLAIDPATGEPAQKTLSFNMACADESTGLVRPISATQTPAQTTTAPQTVQQPAPSPTYGTNQQESILTAGQQ